MISYSGIIIKTPGNIWVTRNESIAVTRPGKRKRERPIGGISPVSGAC